MAERKCPVCSALHMARCWGWELLLTEVGLFIWKARCWIDLLLDIRVSGAGCMTSLTAHSCRPKGSNSADPTVCLQAAPYVVPLRSEKAKGRNDAIVQRTLLYLISCQVLPCLCRSSAVDIVNSPVPLVLRFPCEFFIEASYFIVGAPSRRTTGLF